MIIYHDLKKIFVHAPKTGGTTLEWVLPSYTRHLGQREKLGVHETLQSLRKKKPEFNFSNFKVFMFTRNTWARCASAYAYNTEKLREKGLFVDDPITFFKKKGKIPLIFDMITYNETLHSRVSFYHFENYESEYKRLFKEEFDIEYTDNIPHKNKKSAQYYMFINEILSNDSFINYIGEHGSDEINFFNYKPPEIL